MFSVDKLKEKEKLKDMPIGNCYFSSLAMAFLIAEIDPALVFGGLIGFEKKEYNNSIELLNDYVEGYFRDVIDMELNLDISDEFYYRLGDHIDEITDSEKLKKLLFDANNINQNEALIGFRIGAEYVFYRDDIDIEFWGSNFMDHISLYTQFNFEANKCIVIDESVIGEDGSKFPIIKEVEIDKVVDSIKRSGCPWAFDCNKLTDLFKEKYNKQSDLIKRIITHIKNEAYVKVHSKEDEDNTFTKYLLNNFNYTDGFEEAWFNPKVNIFNIILVHRFFVNKFIKKYLYKYIKEDNTLIKMFDESNKLMNELKYMSYKLSVMKSRKRKNILMKDMKGLLETLDEVEKEISLFLLDSLKYLGDGKFDE